MLKDRQKRKQILARVDEIQDNHCKGCEYNHRENNNYCNTKCQYGKELLILGKMLGNSNKIRNPEHEIKLETKTKLDIKKEVVKVSETKDPNLVKSAEVEMTKEEFKRLHSEGIKKKEIAQMMGIAPIKLYNLVNNQWGLNGWRPDSKKGIVIEPVEEEKVVGPSEAESQEIYTNMIPLSESRDHERAIKDLQNELSDEKLKNKRLAEKLIEQDDRIVGFKDSKKTLQKRIHEFEEENGELLKRLAGQCATINDLKESNEKLRESLANRIGPVATEEERENFYESSKNDYQMQLDVQTRAYVELDTQLNESFKRFDLLEEKYDTVCSTLKMLL